MEAEQGLTNKPGLNASSFGEESVVGVTTHVQLLIEVQPLELALMKPRGEVEEMRLQSLKPDQASVSSVPGSCR